MRYLVEVISQVVKNTSSFEYDMFIEEMGDNLIKNRDSDYWIIGDLDKPLYSATTLRKMRKAELIELAAEHGRYWHGIGSCTKQEIMDELSNVSTRDAYKEKIKNDGWGSCDYTFVAHGYSQGDAIKVLILDEKEYGWVTREHVENIVYGSPLVGYITVHIEGKSVEEIYIDEYIDDLYAYVTWDDIIEKLESDLVSEYKGIILMYLKEHKAGRDVSYSS